MGFLVSCKRESAASPNRDRSNVRSATPQKTILLSVAISIETPISAIVDQFESKYPNVKVRVTSGASNTLARQIEMGANVDLFISADRPWANYVRKQGAVQREIEIIENQIVLVASQSFDQPIQSVDDLRDVPVDRFAIANESVPLGRYTQTVLKHYQVWDSFIESKRYVFGASATQVVAYLTSSEADVGVIYQTDAIANPRLRTIQTFHPPSAPRIVYVLQQIGHELGIDTDTDRLFDFLGSEQAAAVFEKYGFQSLGSDEGLHD